MSQVKIVATIGPRTNNEKSLKELRRAGMDVARLNGSHGDIDWHSETLSMIRRAIPDVPVLLDLPGRKVRIVNLHEEIDITAGDTVVLASAHGNDGSGNGKVQVDYPNLNEAVQTGEIILVDDGSFLLEVREITGQDVVCRAQNSILLKNGKGVHIPRPNYRSEIISEWDKKLIEFASKREIDFLGASFVEVPADVKAIRSLVNRRGPEIVVKIETQQALDNLAKLIEVADALMIDRGDLSVETRSENVALLQKKILKEAAATSCPVIIATEILESMIHSPAPTKAEIGDITTSVLDQASALMLSAETAIGEYPVEAVSTMRHVADAASLHLQASQRSDNDSHVDTVPQAVGDAIALICQNLEITKIVAITISGYAARMVSSKMPKQPILAVTNDQNAARRFNLLPGTKGLYLDIPFSRTSTQHIPLCLEQLWRHGELVDEDLILVTAVGYPRSGNRMNLIQTHLMADLKDSLGWVE
jgi:pyruvate kinase